MIKLEENVQVNMFKLAISGIVAYVLYFLAYAVTLNLFMLLFILFCSIVIVTSKNLLEAFIFYLMIIPSATYVSLNNEFLISYHFLIMLVFLIKCFTSSNFKLNKIATIFYLIFVTYTLIVGTLKGNMSATDLIILLSYAPCLFFTKAMSMENYKKCINLFSFGMLLSLLVGMTRSFIPTLDVALRSADVDIASSEVSRFGGLAYDSNFLGMFSLMLISFHLVILIRAKNNSNEKFLSYVYIIIFTLSGLLSYSKTFFLMYIFIVLFLIFFVWKLNPIKVLAVFVLLVLANYLLEIGLNFSVKDYINSRIIGRATDLSSFTTHRSILWAEYGNYIISSLEQFLFGAGIGNKIISKQVAHNTYLEIIYLLGAIGTTIFLIFNVIIYKIVSYSVKRTRRNVIQWLPLLLFLMVIFSLNCFTNAETPSFIILIIMTLYLPNTNQKIGDEIKSER